MENDLGELVTGKLATAFKIILKNSSISWEASGVVLSREVTQSNLFF